MQPGDLQTPNREAPVLSTEKQIVHFLHVNPFSSDSDCSFRLGHRAHKAQIIACNMKLRDSPGRLCRSAGFEIRFNHPSHQFGSENYSIGQRDFDVFTLSVHPRWPCVVIANIWFKTRGGKWYKGFPIEAGKIASFRLVSHCFYSALNAAIDDRERRSLKPITEIFADKKKETTFYLA